MTSVIVYQLNGGVAIVNPTSDLPLEEVAKKDVPAGVEYKIMDSSELPQDRTFRDAWEIEITEPDGVGIGAETWFAQQQMEE